MGKEFCKKDFGPENEWTYTFHDLPVYNAAKTQINYSVIRIKIGNMEFYKDKKVFVGGTDAQTITGHWQ